MLSVERPDLLAADVVLAETTDRLLAAVTTTLPVDTRMTPARHVQVVLSHTSELVWLDMVLNHAVNANYLSVVFPLSLFLYAALEAPHP